MVLHLPHPKGQTFLYLFRVRPRSHLQSLGEYTGDIQNPASLCMT